MAHFWPVAKPPPPRPRSFERLTSSMTHCGSPLSSTLTQGLEAAVVEVFFHALRIEHAVVPQGHPALAIEEGHVAVKLEELPSDRLAMDLQALDELAAENVLADDLVQVGLALDAIEDFVGPDEHVRAVLLVAGVAGPEATADGHAARRCRDTPAAASFSRMAVSKPLPALPAAALAAADEDFVLGDLLDRAVRARASAPACRPARGG